ncbi:hypothetical protein [Rhodoblastus sp.]|uniref:hypothetical protein n=2 Tax=Rhodoblastus sp. TaxID=1962975 RepID=UPI003F9A3FC7
MSAGRGADPAKAGPMQKGATPGNVQLGSRSEAIPAVLAGGPDFDQGNDGDADKIIASAIPETSTWAMMPLGSIGLGFTGYRRNHRVGIRI